MISADRIRVAVVTGIEAVTSRAVEINDDELFSDFDIDSLDSMSLMLEVEESLEIEFDEIDPKDLATPADYIRVIQAMDVSPTEAESTELA